MYVYVADLDDVVRKLAGADVPIVREPEDTPWDERIATVADPEGNPVVLCQQTLDRRSARIDRPPPNAASAAVRTAGRRRCWRTR